MKKKIVTIIIFITSVLILTTFSFATEMASAKKIDPNDIQFEENLEEYGDFKGWIFDGKELRSETGKTARECNEEFERQFDNKQLERGYDCPACGGSLRLTSSGCSPWTNTGKQRLCNHGYPLGYDVEKKRGCWQRYVCVNCNYETMPTWDEFEWECRGTTN